MNRKALGDRAMKAHDALDAVAGNTFDESAIRARSADVAAVDADIAVAQGRVFSEVFRFSPRTSRPSCASSRQR